MKEAVKIHFIIGHEITSIMNKNNTYASRVKNEDLVLLDKKSPRKHKAGVRVITLSMRMFRDTHQ